MSRERRIRLETLDGAVRRTKWTEPLPRAIRFVLPAHVSSSLFSSDTSALDTHDVSALPCREYELTGYEWDEGVYRERRTVSAALPEAPRLTNDELAEYVERARSMMDRSDVKGWAKLDGEFVVKHREAHSIVHSRGGALMGAWYCAPSWANAGEFVFLMNALRRAVDGT